jgi:hypothetical protein
VKLLVALGLAGCLPPPHCPPPEPPITEVLFTPGQCSECIYSAPEGSTLSDVIERCEQVCRP